jgi:hypothetical protein
MDELVPVILGAILGAVIWRTTRGRTRFVLSVLAVIFAAFTATLASGEYLESWIYLLLDLGEAAFGLVLGYVAAPFLSGRTARDATEAPQ